MFFKKDQSFIVERKNVYAGQLTIPFNGIIIQVDDEKKNGSNGDNSEQRGIRGIEIFGNLVYRGMLFTIDENGLAQDLIYDSPKQPISTVEQKIDTNGPTFINHCVNLEKLLEYLKYNEKLSRSDLNKVFKTLITNSKWLKKHMELFGWTKSGCDGEQILSSTIYDELASISYSRVGKPHRDEQTRRLIKKLI